MKLFLPRPGRKVQTFVDRAALELSLEKNFLPEFQSPIPPSLFLTSFNGTSSSGNADRKGLGREGGWEEVAWLELTVKGRENCARWPFENTMEINLSSLTNLRGHKATEDRGNCFNYNSVRSRISFSLRDSRKKEKKNWDSVNKISTSRPAIGQRWSLPLPLWGLSSSSSSVYFRR